MHYIPFAPFCPMLQTPLQYERFLQYKESLPDGCPYQTGLPFQDPSSRGTTFVYQSTSLSSTKLSSSDATPNTLTCGPQMDAKKRFLFAILPLKYNHLVPIYIPSVEVNGAPDNRTHFEESAGAKKSTYTPTITKHKLIVDEQQRVRPYHLCSCEL